ncbi:MAG: alcohol dehydrogenase catalytic domain-containing protein [Caldilineales bacterium]|nr:alcohol dehydrogenase catalytic domain-containing protein [Caldilineales bacterium]
MTRTRPMAFVTAPGKIEFRDEPLPPLNPTEVLISVKVTTICGSDLHIFKGKHPSVELPIPVGHEIAGEIIEVGAEVTMVEPGDRVAVEPVLVCDACAFCQRGDYHLCNNISFQYRRGQGGFTPWFIADQRWVHRLPESASYLEGALVEPMSVCVHAVRRAAPTLGDRAAIFGDGAIAQYILQAAQLAGISSVYLAGINDLRLAKALEWGATGVVNSLQTDPVVFIQEHTGGLGVERSFEAVGIRQTLVQALQALKKGGTSVLVGLFEQPEVTIPANIFVHKEIGLLGSQGYAWDFQRTLELVGNGRVQLDAIVTHQFGFGEVQQAFDLLMQPNTPAIKVAVMIDE